MSLVLGQEFPEKIFSVNRAKLKVYADASGDQNPIHQDEKFAQSVGLPNVIAHGMYTMALAGEAVRYWLGDECTIVEFSTRFTKPVVVPAHTEVEVKFTCSIKELSETEAVLEVVAVCQDVKVLGQTKVRVHL